MKNKLYYGDNLEVLRKYIKDETVDLAYSDPPFNSKRNYNQIYNSVGKEDRAQAQAFVDTWEWDRHADDGFSEIIANDHGYFTQQTVDLINGLHPVLKKDSLLAYLVSMTLRITEIHRVLKPTGSFYLHCDPTASHYLKLVLDAIFCPRGGDYKNEIIWQRTNAKGLAFTRFPTNHDTILRYTKSDKWIWNAQYIPHDPSYLENFYKYIEPETGRRYRLGDLTNPNKDRPNLTYEFLGITRVWRWTKDRMQDAYEKGIVIQTRPGGVPQLKRYLDEQEGNPIGDVWIDILPVQAQSNERLGYPTQKPESLLERIIKTSSNEGDVVLDCYCGCGTTISVAENLNRNWIGVDITYQSISLILRRIEAQHGKDALSNITLNGIPRDMDSARALALKEDDRVRKEFEKWAVLTYSNNRAIINEKKGGDKGIDGTAFFLTGKDTNAKIVFQVKSGNVGRGDVSKLNNDRTREGAELGVFITLEKPTKGVVDEARAAGYYKHELLDRNYPRIQIVTIEEIIEHHKRLDIPMSLEVLKKAQASTKDLQPDLFASHEEGSANA